MLYTLLERVEKHFLNGEKLVNVDEEGPRLLVQRLGYSKQLGPAVCSLLLPEAWNKIVKMCC